MFKICMTIESNKQLYRLINQWDTIQNSLVADLIKGDLKKLERIYLEPRTLPISTFYFLFF